MTKVNFAAINKHINTKYGDFSGIVEIDGQSSVNSLYELCENNNFSTDNIFIVGYGFGENLIFGSDTLEIINCKILYVKKSDYGKNFDEIEEKILEDKILKVYSKDIKINYLDISKYIKRINFLAFTEIAKNVEIIEIN